MDENVKNKIELILQQGKAWTPLHVHNALYQEGVIDVTLKEVENYLKQR